MSHETWLLVATAGYLAIGVVVVTAYVALTDSPLGGEHVIIIVMWPVLVVLAGIWLLAAASVAVGRWLRGRFHS